MADRERTVYKAVINHEEQYSVWPADRKAPEGWRDEGTTGSLDEVHAYIRKVWTDLRPLSLRRELGER